MSMAFDVPWHHEHIYTILSRGGASHMIWAPQEAAKCGVNVPHLEK
jgi:hypothetical protein